MKRLSLSFFDANIPSLRSLVCFSRPLATAAGTWFSRSSTAVLDEYGVSDSKPSTTGRDSSLADRFPAWASGPQLRGYKSNKKSLKPLNTASSWRAAEPFLSPLGTNQNNKQPPIIDSAVPDVPEAPKPIAFRRLGVITGQYTLELQKVRT